MTSTPGEVCEVVVIDSIDNLDHDTITGHLKTSYPTRKKYTRSVRHYTRENLRILDQNLSIVPWLTLLAYDRDLDSNVKSFYSLLNNKMDKVIPVVTFTVRPSDRPGMTREVRLLFQKTHKLYRIGKKTKIESDIELYRVARREAKKIGLKPRQSFMEEYMTKMF